MKINKQSDLKANQNNRHIAPDIPDDSILRRKMVIETIQYPIILILLVVCITSIFYLLFLSPMFGGRWEVLAFSVISAISAVGSYLYRYSKEYPAKSREIYEYLKQVMEESNEAEIQQLYENLEDGFSSLASAGGLKSLAALKGEYQQLKISLNQGRATDPISISAIPGLAEEAYRRGLGVLSDALELMKVIHEPRKDKLEKDIAGLKKEIQVLANQPGQSELIRVKKGSLAYCRERLAMINQLQLHIEQLLYQAQRCEGVLHSTRVELAEVRIGGSETSVDAVVESLQERIRQAKEVQDEIKKLGY